MERITVKVDKQAISLLDITKWSNLACILLLAVLNAVNCLRAGSGDGTTLFAGMSRETVLIVSALLGAYMAARCFTAVAVKRRLEQVSFTITETGVEGMSMPEPMRRDRVHPGGEPFSVPFEAIQSVRTAEVMITKKHPMPSLAIECENATYVVPAPEQLKELIRQIEGRLSGAWQ